MKNAILASLIAGLFAVTSVQAEETAPAHQEAAPAAEHHKGAHHKMDKDKKEMKHEMTESHKGGKMHKEEKTTTTTEKKAE